MHGVLVGHLATILGTEIAPAEMEYPWVAAKQLGQLTWCISMVIELKIRNFVAYLEVRMHRIIGHRFDPLDLFITFHGMATELVTHCCQQFGGITFFLATAEAIEQRQGNDRCRYIQVNRFENSPAAFT